MERRIKEAVRYLGYGRNAADERTLALIEDRIRADSGAEVGLPYF